LRAGPRRRGKAAAHVLFGEDVALLASDALFAEAMALVFRAQEGEPARVLAAVIELMSAVGPAGLIGGQYIGRRTAHARDDSGRREPDELKTGRLMAAAVGTVLTLTGQTGPSAAALRKFAARVGVLYQIVNDLPASTHGERRRPQGSDCATRQDDRTYLGRFGLERTRELARASHAAARTVLTEIPADTSTLERIADEIISAKLGSPA
jgi:geranylgeranyl diphosphate synthase type II